MHGNCRFEVVSYSEVSFATSILPLARCHEQLPGDTVNVVNNGRVEWYVPDNHDDPRGLFDIVIFRFY